MHIHMRELMHTLHFSSCRLTETLSSMHAAVGAAAGSIPEEVMAEREFNRTGSSTITGPQKKASPRKADASAANVAHSDTLTGASFRRSLRAIVPGGSSPKRQDHTNGSSDSQDIEMGAVPQEVRPLQ